MATATDTREPLIDLGNPLRAVGHTAFLKHMGGGSCLKCTSYASVLMPDGKCARCSGVCDTPILEPKVIEEAGAAKK